MVALYILLCRGFGRYISGITALLKIQHFLEETTVNSENYQYFLSLHECNCNFIFYIIEHNICCFLRCSSWTKTQTRVLNSNLRQAIAACILGYNKCAIVIFL